jgi:hypothetical protein
MGRCAEQQQFRDPNAKRMARRWWRFPAQEGFQHGINAAEPPQDRGRNAMRRRPVARFKPRGQRFQRFFQGPMCFQHGIQHIACGAPGGQAGRAPWPGWGFIHLAFMAPAPRPC